MQDKTNPFRFPFIGVEKYLNLFSNNNYDDYCLAFLFTNRDFDNGVLGLAWVGASSGAVFYVCNRCAVKFLCLQ